MGQGADVRVSFGEMMEEVERDETVGQRATAKISVTYTFAALLYFVLI